MEAGHAAHNRLFRGHSVGIGEANGHVTGTFRAEILASGAAAEATCAD
jgi:hypothetical protein